MQPLSSATRSSNLAQLAEQQFDVLVIGGGVTGAGVALDAVARGYRVALVEKIDFASGTSSKSTKLVHGGIRYLPNFDFPLVHEALVERGLLLQNAPYLVRPVPFVLPIYEGDKHPVGMPFTTPGGIGLTFLLDIGLWLYDGLAGRHNIKRHRRLSREQVLKQAPNLVQEGLKEGFVYYDAQTNDARLTMALIRTAAQYGATIVNYCEAESFLSKDGQICGAQVRDTLNNQSVTVHARHVINAAGIFSEQVEALTGTQPQIQIEPSKGVHLVLSKDDIQIGDSAIVLPETEDKRILFIVPWESRIIFGTTDTGSGDLDHPLASPEDITYLLKYLNRYLKINLSEKDIVSVYAGYRPLIKPRNTNGASTAKISRSHSVLQSPSGLVSIVGGKMTTYRRMAQDTMDVISRRDGVKPVHPTHSIPLQGSAAWPIVQRKLAQRGRDLGLSEETITHLGHSYGSEAATILDIAQENATLTTPLIADLPYIQAEVIYACRYEMAMTPYDILARRTSITLEDRHQGLNIVDDIAALMAQELHWTNTQQQDASYAFREAMQRQAIIEPGVQRTV
ncbi:MAG TPA: glycerol-3-phosphate dehydrogenase/oxidase [Ktedonobacteraceae bacterium]|jgi:glycerol-3-phosphate dehydrogenase